jgi:hypothetical protein
MVTVMRPSRARVGKYNDTTPRTCCPSSAASGAGGAHAGHRPQRIAARYERMRGKPGSPWQVRLPKESRRVTRLSNDPQCYWQLLADRCQVEEFLFAEDIFGFFGKLPIHHRLVPKEIIPIHACHCAEDLS